jgi:hypothetical protein
VGEEQAPAGRKIRTHAASLAPPMYSSWDEKMFNRSGDLVALAVLKTMNDSEMASSQNAKGVLLILAARSPVLSVA